MGTLGWGGEPDTLQPPHTLPVNSRLISDPVSRRTPNPKPSRLSFSVLGIVLKAQLSQLRWLSPPVEDNLRGPQHAQGSVQGKSHPGKKCDERGNKKVLISKSPLYQDARMSRIPPLGSHSFG